MGPQNGRFIVTCEGEPQTCKPGPRGTRWTSLRLEILCKHYAILGINIIIAGHSGGGLFVEEDPVPEGSAGYVLLVDDNSSIRDLLARLLATEGFQAVHAEDGIDGVVKLRERLPKVIICDLQMPRMTGFEFIEVVRRRFPTIPVVVLAGSIPSEFSEEIKPDCWFEKSMLRFPELMQTINYLARRTPDHADLPKVITTPTRIRPDGTGYIALTCTDCLRSFKVASTPQNKTGEQTAFCTHCQACIPFFFET